MFLYRDEGQYYHDNGVYNKRGSPKSENALKKTQCTIYAVSQGPRTGEIQSQGRDIPRLWLIQLGVSGQEWFLNCLQMRRCENPF